MTTFPADLRAYLDADEPDEALARKARRAFEAWTPASLWRNERGDAIGVRDLQDSLILVEMAERASGNRLSPAEKGRLVCLLTLQGPHRLDLLSTFRVFSPGPAR